MTSQRPPATLEREQRSVADIFPDPLRAAMLPAEVVNEIRSLVARAEPPTAPRILAVVASRDVEAAAAVAHQLQDASIKMTFPEDWVVFRSKDGAELGYLQDVGCARVRPLWAISFESTDLGRDCVETKIPGNEDEDVSFEIVVSGECALTGESQSEVGYRSSAGFFGPAWRGSKDKPVERAKVRADIRKSALSNGRGRLIRLFTGLAQVPVERLVRAGLDRQRLRGAEFQSGTKGGSGAGAGASQPQIDTIVKNGFDFRKVAGLGEVVGRDAFAAIVKSAALTGGREGTASKVIDRLMKAKRDEVTVDELEKLLGVAIGTPEPGAEG